MNRIERLAAILLLLQENEYTSEDIARHFEVSRRTVLRDVQAYDEAKQAIAEGEELIPSDVTYAILDGENPIRVWRDHRGLTQQQLAGAAGISVPYLSQLESGKRTGSPHVLAAIADALGVALDDIVEA